MVRKGVFGMTDLTFINQLWNGKSYETHIKCDDSVRRMEIVFAEKDGKINKLVIDRKEE